MSCEADAQDKPVKVQIQGILIKTALLDSSSVAGLVKVIVEGTRSDLVMLMSCEADVQDKPFKFSVSQVYS